MNSSSSGQERPAFLSPQGTISQFPQINEGETVKGKFLYWGMCSGSQDGDHKREETNLEKLWKKKIGYNKDASPGKARKGVG